MGLDFLSDFRSKRFSVTGGKREDLWYDERTDNYDFPSHERRNGIQKNRLRAKSTRQFGEKLVQKTSP